MFRDGVIRDGGSTGPVALTCLCCFCSGTVGREKAVKMGEWGAGVVMHLQGFPAPRICKGAWVLE